jgi:peroxiredoxin
MVLLALLGSWPVQLAAAEAEVASPPVELVEVARDGVVGTRARAFRLQTLDGDTIDLADLYGKKAIYLKFWATWCGPCRAQMPHFENTYQNAGDDLVVIGINTGINETLEDIQDFREEYGIHMPIAVDDGTLGSTFNLRITPQHVVIGKDGVVQYMGQQADEELEHALQTARTAPASQISEFDNIGNSGLHFEVGDLLPAETLNTSEGDSFMLQDLQKQAGTVLVFMIPWCESYLAETRPTAAETCRLVREQVETLKQQHADVRWLGINSGLWTVASDLPDYVKTYHTTLPLTLDVDSHLFRAFDVMTMPTVIVADAAGRVIKRVEGYDPVLEEIVSAL